VTESSIVFQTLFNGIMLGLLLIIFALGLSLVFGIMRILNFAHGEIYMLGGFGMWGLFAQHHVNYFLALALTMSAVALIGIIIERVIFKPHCRRVGAAPTPLPKTHQVRQGDASDCTRAGWCCSLGHKSR